MINLYVKNKTFFGLVFFLLAPLYSVPYIVKGMVDRNKYSFVLWAFFMGLLGVLSPPVGDLYRYAEDYYIFKDCNWDTFLSILTVKFDYILSIISYVFSKLDIPFDLTRFLFNFFAHYLLGLLYLDITNSNIALKRDSKYNFYAVILFMGFSFSLYVYRFYFSMILFLYGAYKVYFKECKSGWLFIFLSVLNHFSFVVFLLGFLLLKMKLFRFNRKLVISLFVMMSFLDTDFLISIMKTLELPTALIDKYSTYFDGYWAGRYLVDRSWRYRLMVFLVSLVSYVGSIIYVIYYNYGKRSVSAFVNLFLIMALLVSPFSIVYERFLVVLLLSIKVYFLLIYDGSKQMRFMLKILCLFVIFGSFVEMYGMRRQIAVSQYDKLFYSTSFQLLQSSYDMHWINGNIDSDGNIIGNQ
jgi:hypothetical protein